MRALRLRRDLIAKTLTEVESLGLGPSAGSTQVEEGRKEVIRMVGKKRVRKKRKRKVGMRERKRKKEL